MRIKSITLRRFRGYLEEQNIPFGPNLTILWGPNGFGKSTILDGVEWLLRGQLHRYRGTEEARSTDFIKHIDSSEEPSTEVLFEDEGHPLVLRRDRLSKEKSELLVATAPPQWLAEPEATSVLRQVDSGVQSDIMRSHFFPDTFVSYHLMGQQAIRELVLAKQRDQYEALAPIIGVDQYVRATEASLQATIQLTRMFESVIESVTAKQAELEAVQRQRATILDSLGETFGGQGSLSDWLRKSFVEYSNSLSAVDEQIPDNPPEPANDLLTFLEHFLSGSLARLAAKRRGSELELAEMRRFQGEVRSLLSRKGTVERTTSELQTTVDLLRQMEARRQGLEKEQSDRSRELESVTRRLARVRSMHASTASLDQLRKDTASTQFELDQLSASEAALANGIRTLDNEQTILGKRADDLTSSLRDSVARIAELSQNVEMLNGLFKDCADLLAKEIRVNQLREECAAHLRRAQELAPEKARKAEDFKSASKRQESLRNRVEQISHSRQHFQGLLVQLRAFVLSPACPLCGTQFQTQQELLKRIDETLANETSGLESLAQELSNSTQELRATQSVLLAMDEEARNLEISLRDCAATTNEFDEKLQLVQQKSSRLGILFTENLEHLATEIGARRSATQMELANQRVGQDTLDSELKQLERQGNEVSERRVEHKSQMQELQPRVTSLRDSLRDFHNKERALTADLTVTAATEEGATNVTALEQERATLQQKLQDTREDLSQLVKELSRLDDLRREMSSVASDVTQLESQCRARARALKVTEDFDGVDFLSLRLKAAEDRIARVGESLKSGEKLRAALIAGGHSLRLTELDGRIGKLTLELNNLRANQKTINQGIVFAGQLGENLRKAGEMRTQRILETCSKLTEQYYNRVYPHLLWSNLVVGVDSDPTRGGRAQLEMYARRSTQMESSSDGRNGRLNIKLSFSTGQLNLFAISLFLALAQQRGHEKFSTLFLDDPVQAMDDMRIADLCWVLLQLSRSRQIIIATSNQNFMELLFHRAAALSNDVHVISHLFESMTSRGPVIVVLN